MKSLTTTEIKRLNREWRRRTTWRIRIALDGLSNPFNVGSIFRTAAVLGVEALYLVGTTPGPDDPKVRKTSLGTEHHTRTIRADSLAEAVGAARRDDFTIVAVELASGASPMTATEFGPRTCLVIGNEGHGLSPAALGLCDAAMYVPQPGKVASLNVATATALALYEVRRAEWTADGSPDEPKRSRAV